MRNRFQNAVSIQGGACNPLPIVKALSDAVDEIRAGGGGTNDIWMDPAVRLIVHQMSFLTKCYQIDEEICAYTDLMAECERHV